MLNAMKVTVMIPTLNSEEYIEDCLRALMNQTYKDFEIVLVDGHSKDRTVEIGEKYGARIIYDDGNTRAHACNTGLRETETDIVVFTDADTIPEKDWLEHLIKHFDDDKVASVGGPNTAPENDPFMGKAADLAYGSEIMTGNTRYGKIPSKVTEINHNPGCNAAYRKKVIDEIGGFEEDLPTAEDLVLDYKITSAGYKILFDPNALVWHRRRPTLKAYIKQIYRYGIGRAIANKRHPELKSWMHIAPTIGIFAFILLALISTISFLFLKEPFRFLPLILLISILLIYFLISLFGASKSHSKYKNASLIAVAPFLIALGHIAWGLGYLKGLIRG